MNKGSKWDRHAIRAEIHRRGMTLASLARQYNLPAASIRVTLARKRPVIQADLAISDFLAVPLHQLWADRYDDKGNRLLPLKPRTRRKPPSPPLTEAA